MNYDEWYKTSHVNWCQLDYLIIWLLFSVLQNWSFNPFSAQKLWLLSYRFFETVRSMEIEDSFSFIWNPHKYISCCYVSCSNTLSSQPAERRANSHQFRTANSLDTKLCLPSPPPLCELAASPHQQSCVHSAANIRRKVRPQRRNRQRNSRSNHRRLTKTYRAWASVACCRAVNRWVPAHRRPASTRCPSTFATTRPATPRPKSRWRATVVRSLSLIVKRNRRRWIEIVVIC